MKRCPACWWFPLVSILLILRPACADDAPGEITAGQVRTAIERGITYLKGTQNQNGAWNDYIGNTGGVTALCTLALLNAGVPVNDPQIERALDYLRSLPPDKTYVVSLQTMVLCLAEPKKDLLLIRRNVQWLEQLQNANGSWTYSQGLGMGDPSNSQFALLALYEAERVGVPVTERTWNLALQYWLRLQNNDGSWPYEGQGAPGRGSMTCAGITSVFIASGRLNSGDAEVTPQGLKCCGQRGNNPAVKAMEDGLTWLGNNFSVQINPGPPQVQRIWNLYYLYAVERVGRMTSHRFFISRGTNQHYDWYRMGAEYLVAKQDVLSGYWKGMGHAEDDPRIATSFALLFLAKGRRPILISKARYGNDNDWARHRSDLANLTTYVETKWKKDFPLGLSWQIVDLADATLDDLLQTPVLYLSGSKDPELLDQAQKLREYIDRGGFIFAEACCTDSEGFDTGFRALVDKIFEEPEYRLKPVPPEHPLWTAEEPVRPALRPNLWSVDYGCRTSVVYVAPPEPNKGDLPNGLSCYWEIAAGRDRKLNAVIQEQLNAALSMGINVLAYATNRALKSKDENFQLADQNPKEEDTFERGKRYVANLRHPGGCDAAPGALPGLLRAANRELKARFSPEQRQVQITDPDLFNYDVLFMHGRANFRLTDEEKKALHKYLERGTLIADSICANRDFTASFRREINDLFADQGIKLEPIPANHPMFSTEFGGYDLSQVTRRVPQSRAADGPLQAKTHHGAPELEGLKIGDRYAVIFSPYDLSCALEKHDSLECEGYTKDDAERIGLNLLLYATFEF
ncbi:MAG TPA: DUF4159 domain-containing protein [Pirellulales bacterium]|jgi:hypothetical protein|nr:DUF4159 domain-containing protein [Pirellulales bacterium]